MIQEDGNYRILGAGLLSAPDEMEYAMSSCPNKPDFDPKILAKIQFDDTTLQDLAKIRARYEIPGHLSLDQLWVRL